MLLITSHSWCMFSSGCSNGFQAGPGLSIFVMTFKTCIDAVCQKPLNVVIFKRETHDLRSAASFAGWDVTRYCWPFKPGSRSEVTTLAIFKEQRLAENGRGHLYYSASWPQQSGVGVCGRSRARLCWVRNQWWEIPVDHWKGCTMSGGFVLIPWYQRSWHEWSTTNTNITQHWEPPQRNCSMVIPPISITSSTIHGSAERLPTLWTIRWWVQPCQQLTSPRRWLQLRWRWLHDMIPTWDI